MAHDRLLENAHPCMSILRSTQYGSLTIPGTTSRYDCILVGADYVSRQLLLKEQDLGLDSDSELQ
jgi:hypothetical protein